MRFIRAIFIILYSPLCWAQQISGTISDDLGNPIPFSTVIIKANDSTGHILHFLHARNGQFIINLQAVNSPQVGIEIASVGFLTAYQTLTLVETNNSYQLHFTLLPETNQVLEEVVVKAERYPFQVKNDTVVFDVSRYADAHDRKLEDVLKKLPGIEVNQSTGAIKYKGKEIETVMIEGDNLFGFNYTMGTKNINIDVIEAIEAIENFNENPLLRDIEASDKVALNLKLKEGEMDFSGNIETGFGLSDAPVGGVYVFNGTGLSISSKFKAFITASSNNIGINHSPFNYFSRTLTPEQLRERQYRAEKPLLESATSSVLDELRSNLNQQLFGNFSGIYQLSSKASLKTNLYFINDRILAEQHFVSQNTVDGQEIIWENLHNTRKKPTMYRGDINFKYRPTSRALLEYNGKLSHETMLIDDQIRTNGRHNFQSHLTSENLYLNQYLVFTRKLTQNKAFQANVVHAHNRIPQHYSLFPSVYDSLEGYRNEQQSTSQKDFIEAKGTMMGATANGKYSVTIGADNTYSPLFTDLELIAPSEASQSINYNNLYYQKLNLYHSASLSYIIKNLTFVWSYSIRQLMQILNDKTAPENIRQSNFIFEPKLSVQMPVSQNSHLKFMSAYNQNTLADRYSFRHEILTSNRTLTANTPDLSLQKIWTNQLMYINHDLYNHFQFNTFLTYRKLNGNYFDRIDLSRDLTIFNNFFMANSADEFASAIRISKFIPFISTNLSLQTRYSYFNYFNFVNDSDLRQNDQHSYHVEATLSTGFDFPVNIENSFSLIRSTSQSASGMVFSNTFITNSARLKIKPHKYWMFRFQGDYYLPNSRTKSNTYLFLDGELFYRPKNKQYETGLIVRNLLNTHRFATIDVNDFSTTLFSINVQPRYLMLSLSYQL